MFDYVVSLPVKIVIGGNTPNYICNVNNYNIVVNDEVVGTIGVVHPRVQQKIDSSKYIIVSEINITKVNKYSSNQIVIEKLSKYPVTTLDFNFILDVNDVYATIDSVASTVKSDLTYKYELVDIFHNVNDNTKSYTIRYFVTSMDHTLSSSEIEEFHKNVITTFENNNIHLKAE
jgi:phenylalanyl-tRNA synthetase beta chain